jgi:hypothetical protein
MLSSPEREELKACEALTASMAAGLSGLRTGSASLLGKLNGVASPASPRSPCAARASGVEGRTGTLFVSPGKGLASSGEGC